MDKRNGAGITGSAEEMPRSKRKESSHAAEQDAIPKILDFVTEYAKAEEFTDLRISEITAAVREAMGNVIDYSYEGRAGKVDVACSMDNSGQMLVIITDYGRPSNPLLASDPFFAADYEGIKKPSTRFMKRFMSSVEWRRDQDKNILTFTISRIPTGF